MPAAVRSGWWKARPEIARAATFRGRRTADYLVSLERLERGDWVTREGSTWELSLSGQTRREDVESHTDEWFYASWSHLSDDDRSRLASVTERLRLGLT